MADLNQSLKDYMSRSNKDTTTTAKYSLLPTKWFSSGEDIEDKPQTEAANGWLIDAQSDPLLPSLVCCKKIKKSMEKIKKLLITN